MVVTYGPCFICKRDCDETSINVDFGHIFGIQVVCGICQDAADGLMDEPEDEPDFNVEGMPEWNGAFR